MLKGKVSVCIEAPKEKVWKVLSDVLNIHLWTEAILSIDSESEKCTGIGAVRICNLKGNMHVKEKFIAWDEGTSYTYEAGSILFMKSAITTWSVKFENEKTLLTSEVEITLKGGIFGKLLEPLMDLIISRMGPQTLASIKYFIEVGKPYEGKYSRLPKIPLTC